jgi:flagellar protein FlgJ
MGISLDGISSYLDQAKSANSSAGVERTLSSDLSTASDEKLMEACKGFESYLIEQVVKEMEKTIPEDKNADAGMSQIKDYYKEELVQKMSGKIAEQNGNSFAQTMYEQMKRNYNLQ